MEQTTMTRLEGHEVLQPSSLDKYSWPERNFADQTVCQWSELDAVAISQAARRMELNPDHFRREAAKRPVWEAILWLLGHPAVNFNGATRVRQEPKWRTRSSRLVEAGQPIPIAYPLFCAIANPAKQHTRPGPNAGERAAIEWFKYVDELVREIYPPGLHIHILSDATLYNNALQNTLAFANRYIQQARAMVDEAGAGHCVSVHDYAMLLAPGAREFDALYNGYYARLLRGDQTLISTEEQARLLRSMRASVNSERLGLTYEDQRALFGPTPDPNHPLAGEIERMARAALFDQMAVKLACVELDLPERIWPGHIRASCHKGVKSGVAVVGLRVYPEYYKRSSLLPYHGKPLLRADGRLVVQPEFMLRSRPELARIVNEAGEALLYKEVAPAE